MWLFRNERLAQLQIDVLHHGGAKVRATANLTDAQVQALLAKLPPGRTVEDCR